MITASIVTYKTDLEELVRVLRCVVQSSAEILYVVDNSPTDLLRDTVCGFGPKVVYLFGQGNIGYGGGHNIAIRRATECRATYHAVINPDIFFDPEVIERVAAYMDRNEQIGQLMPKIVYPDGRLQYLCKLLPTPVDLIGRRFLPLKSCVEKRNFRFEMKASGYDEEMEVPFLSGCFMFLRVSALEKVNGFDDRFFMYCEDIDLCRRIGMAGYKTVYFPQATVVHAHKKESFKSKTMLRAHIKSAVRYFNKWGWFFDTYRRKTNRKAVRQYRKTARSTGLTEQDGACQ